MNSMIPHGHVLQPPPSGAGMPAAQVARAHKAAQEFEAMAIGQFLEPMFDTVDLSASLFGGGEAEQTWKPLLVTEMSKHIAANGGLGLAPQIFAQMLRNQETHR